MTPAAILDMDGTLCDVSSIRYHVNPSDPRFSGRQRFDLFHAESVDCPPNDQAVELYRSARAQGMAIVIVTARKVQWRYHTIVWLAENGIEYDLLLMRADSDDRPDYEVKADLLTEILVQYEPVLAVDDNPAVLALWEEHGIPTERIPGWETT
jgi:beta-phosphoglucomutase-like phosphatase (HAD superfamily)